MSIFGSKRTHFGKKKGPKKGQKDFCQNFQCVILVIYHKCSFNMQNKQNPLSGLGEIGENDNLGSKWTNVGQKWPK